MCVLLNGLSDQVTFSLIPFKGTWMRFATHLSALFFSLRKVCGLLLLSHLVAGLCRILCGQVESLFDFALCSNGKLKLQRFESLQLIQTAMPRVKYLVKLDQLLSQLVDLLASLEGEVSVVGALGGGSLDLVSKAHEAQLEV